MPKKDAYYFPHDSNARHDPKIISMMTEYGTKGYGTYWIIVEILREQQNNQISLKEKYSYISLAKETGCSVDEIKHFIDECVNTYCLFKIEDGLLYSESLNERMSSLKDKKEKAKAAAEKRWNKVVDTKKDVIFEIKEGVKTGISVLTDEASFAGIAASMVMGKFGGLNTAYIYKCREECLDWLKSKGKRYKDYEAFFRNWVRKSIKINPPDSQEKKTMVY